MPLDFNKRQYGEAIKTETNLSRVPLNPQTKPVAPAQSGGSPPPAGPLPDEYQRDVKATTPLAGLPRDVQEQVVRAKAIYELAAHPGATQFEIDLAHALMDDLAPKATPEAAQPKEEPKKQEAK